MNLLDKLAVCAEYGCIYGGSQRTAAIYSKWSNKPLYLIGEDNNFDKVWNQIVIKEIPKENFLFSIVVDEYNLKIIDNKKMIKFVHDKSTIDFLTKFDKSKEVIWITHRKRVFDKMNYLGYKIYLIPDGFTLYDGDLTILNENNNKFDECAFISRIEPEKKPEWAIEASKKANIKLNLCGGQWFNEYVNQLLINQNNLNFIKAINNRGVPEKIKNNILRRSKVLLHCSTGGLRDFLEYSILDGLLFGLIPICITPDNKQFNIIEEKELGFVVNNPDEAALCIKKALKYYDYYKENGKIFIKSYINKQKDMFDRWNNTLQKIISDNL